MEAVVYVRCVDDVEGGYGEGEGCCFDAAAENDLGLFCESPVGFILRR